MELDRRLARGNGRGGAYLPCGCLRRTSDQAPPGAASRTATSAAPARGVHQTSEHPHGQSSAELPVRLGNCAAPTERRGARSASPMNTSCAPSSRPWPPRGRRRTRRKCGARLTAGSFAERQGIAMSLAIEVAGEFAGQLTLSNMQYGTIGNCWIGYWVHSAGRGAVATAAVALGTDLAMLGLGLHRVEATVMEDNPASRRVLENTGYRVEGRLQRNLHIDGQWTDHLLVAQTIEELGPGLPSGSRPRGVFGRLSRRQNFRVLASARRGRKRSAQVVDTLEGIAAGPAAILRPGWFIRWGSPSGFKPLSSF